MDFYALKQELGKPAYTNLSDQAAADALNAPSLAGKRIVTNTALVGWLIKKGHWYAVRNSTTQAAVTARDALMSIRSFDFNDAETVTALGQILTGLVDDSSIPTFDATARAELEALGDDMRSIAQSLNLPEIDAGHVQAARRL